MTAPLDDLSFSRCPHHLQTGWMGALIIHLAPSHSWDLTHGKGFSRI